MMVKSTLLQFAQMENIWQPVVKTNPFTFGMSLILKNHAEKWKLKVKSIKFCSTKNFNGFA
jgi:hypothetical protein